jgi:predicted ATPase
VELGPLQEPHRVPLAIAATLGVKEEGGRPIEDALARHVKARGMLVILDNCEHLLEASAAAARLLLSAGPDVRVLATSREPLRIVGECTHVVAGLSVPGPREALAADSAGQFEAVRLFVDRASAASPGFALTPENVTSVAAICNRLDGIPLAIELAAARARSISVAQIATRLKDRFKLLTAGDPTALPRQRTLRAMIDWSHDLLPETERALFRRLAVFAGGWTLEAAEFVCTQGVVRNDAVLDLLSLLVEKSLVGFDAGAQRYRMLETVHEYAVERLVACGEAAALGDRHLEHFTALAELARPQLAGPGQGEWLLRLDAERENILSAHEWAGHRPEHAPKGLRLVNSVKLYWMNRGLLELGLRVTLEALQRDTAGKATPDRAQGLFNAGQIRYFMGQHREARACLEESLAIARLLGDAYVATVLQPLGMAALAEGAMGVAQRCFEEAVELSESRGEERWLAAALNSLAMLHRVQGSPERSCALYERVLVLCRESGNAEVEAIVLLNYAMVSIGLERIAQGAAMLAQAMRLARAIGSAPAGQGALDACAGLAAARGEWERAAGFYGAAQAQAARSGVQRDSADALFLQPRIDAARAALGPEAFAAGQALGGAYDLAAALAHAQAWMEAGTAALEARLTANR